MEVLLHTKLLREASARTPEEAFALSTKSLRMRKTLLGPQDQKVAASYGIMAVLAIACGRYTDALGFLDECLSIRKMKAEEEIENISYTHLYYGWCYAMMGRYATAHQALTNANNILINHYGIEQTKTKPLCCWILGAQGYVYRMMGFDEQGESADKEALNISIAIYGPFSPRSFVPWYRKLWWDWKNGKLDAALESTVELVNEMEEKDFYAGHRARALNLLSKMQDQLGRKDESKSTMASALHLCGSVQDEQWMRELDVFRTLEGPPPWAQREIDRKFDELVFFHDR